jgi:hypothetical protein
MMPGEGASLPKFPSITEGDAFAFLRFLTGSGSNPAKIDIVALSLAYCYYLVIIS